MLRILLGIDERTRSDGIYQEIARRRQISAGNIYVITPEQFTLSCEKELIDALGVQGLLDIQVLSPSRLSDLVFEATAYPAQAPVDERGLAMALRSVSVRVQDQLRAYSRSIQYNGFSKLMLSLISTLKQSDNLLTEDSLSTLSPRLREKLTDAQTLSSALDDYLQSLSYMDRDDRTQQSIALIPQAAPLQGADFFFTGFSYLSPRECRMITTLLLCANSVTLTFGAGMATDAVRMRLKEAAHAMEIPVEEKRLTPLPCRFEAIRSTLFSYQDPEGQPDPAVTTAEVRNEEEEARLCAWQVAELVKQGAQYQDIFVACAHADRDQVARKLRSCGIPVFTDTLKSLTGNGCVHFILCLLRVLYRGYKGEDMIALLKTGVLTDDTHGIHLMDLYHRQMNINGRRQWAAPFTRGGESFDLELLNRLRIRMLHPLFLLAALGKEATSRQWCETFYTLLEEEKIEEKLSVWAETLKEEGYVQESAVCQRVWNMIIECFQQLETLLGDLELTPRLLYDILSSGFSAVSVGIIPPLAEAVSVGDLHRSKPGQVKHLLILGCEEGMLTRNDAPSLLDAQEMETLKEIGILLQTPQDIRAQDRYDLFNLISGAQESLYMSYKALSQGEPSEPDAIFSRIQKLAGNQGRKSGQEYPSLAIARNSLSPLVRFYTSGQALNPFQQELLSYAQKKEPERLERLLKAALPASHEQAVWASAALKGVRSISATQLEAFYNCPRAFFYDHTLAPMPIKEHLVNSLNRGNYLHEAMRRFVDLTTPYLINNQVFPEAEAAIQAITEELNREFEYGLLESSAQMRSNSSILLDMFRNSARMYLAGAQRSSFRPAAPKGTELSLGKDIPTIFLDRDIVLSGRVDRLDTVTLKGVAYLRVSDYKSGAGAIDITDAVNGLSMQTWLYLYALTKGWKTPAAAAGAFIVPTSDLWVDEQAEYDKEFISKLRPTGWVRDESAVREATDIALQDKPRTEYLKGALDRKLLLQPEVADAMLTLCARNAQSAVEQLRQGAIGCHPVRENGHNACKYCRWKAVCDQRTVTRRRLLQGDDVTRAIQQAMNPEDQ